MNYDEVRKELAEANRQVTLLVSDIDGIGQELTDTQKTLRDEEKQVKALRQILRAADEPYEIEKLKGVG